MISKQAKDHPSRARSTEHWPELLAYRGFDAAACVQAMDGGALGRGRENGSVIATRSALAIWPMAGSHGGRGSSTGAMASEAETTGTLWQIWQSGRLESWCPSGTSAALSSGAEP